METPIWVLRRAQNRAGAVLLPMLLLVCSAVLLALPGASARAASLNLRQPLSAGVAHTRPGIPSAAASPQAVAGELAQVTGLTPSQVAAANVCPTPSPGTAQCLAQAVVLRSTHARVHPHVHARATFTQVFPRHRSGQAGASGATTGTPATGATAPPTASTPAYLQQAYDLTYLSQTARRIGHRRDRRRLRRSERRVRPRALPQQLRAAGVHDRERVLQEGQRERAGDTAAVGRSRMGGRGEPRP